MVREIVTRSWCDLHMLNDERVEMSETHDVTLDGDGYTLDLCPEHVDAFESFASIVRAGSAKTKTTKTTTKTTPARTSHPSVDGLKLDGTPNAKQSNHDRVCLACRAVLTTAWTFKHHLNDEHGAGMEAIYGTTCPLCASTLATSQALGIHAAKTHAEDGVRDVATLFEYAREHGDTHGIVRERDEKARDLPNASPLAL